VRSNDKLTEDSLNINKVLYKIVDNNNNKPIKHELFNFKNNKPKHTFVADGYCKETKTIREFYGCYFHGCRSCFPELTLKYNQTMER
jgi:hypothetical protein